MKLLKNLNDLDGIGENTNIFIKKIFSKEKNNEILREFINDLNIISLKNSLKKEN